MFSVVDDISPVAFFPEKTYTSLFSRYIPPCSCGTHKACNVGISPRQKQRRLENARKTLNPDAN